MPFQSSVNLYNAFGVVGDLFFEGPLRALAYILDSDGTAQKVGNVFTVTDGANGGDNSSQTVAGKAKVGGTGKFAGILCNSKVLASVGTVAGGPLAPTLSVPDNTIGELVSMGFPVISLPGPANVGDLLTFDSATGNLNSIAPLALYTGSTSTTTLTVSAITAGRLAVGSLVQGAGVIPGTYITALGTGLGGTGTYTINNSQSVSSEAMTSPNLPEPAFSGTGSLATDGLLTVASVVSGSLTIGSRVVGTGIDATITALGTGVGGTGTYQTNQTGSVVTTEAITSTGDLLVPGGSVYAYDVTSGLAVANLLN